MPEFDMIAHLEDQYDFSMRTFGPGQRTGGNLDHMSKELIEIRDNPDDLEEWIDMILLACDGAMRRGFTPGEIVDMMAYKLAKNKKREWPDWRTQPTDKAITHIER